MNADGVVVCAVGDTCSQVGWWKAAGVLVGVVIFKMGGWKVGNFKMYVMRLDWRGL